MADKRYVLASTSPRRKELVSRLDVKFEYDVPTCDETLDLSVAFHESIVDLAKRKALSVLEKHPDKLILGADTLVILEGKHLGKPQDKHEARHMLKQLSDKTHEVITGCAFVENGNIKTFYSTAQVTFDALSEQDIEDYIETQEPFGKAGAYAIQGYGARYVNRISGDYYAIMGLPINMVHKALQCYAEGVLFTHCNLM